MRIKGIKSGIRKKKVKEDNSNNYSFNIDNENELNKTGFNKVITDTNSDNIKIRFYCLIFSIDGTWEIVNHIKEIKSVPEFKRWFISNYFRSVIIKAVRVYPDEKIKLINDLILISTGKIATDSYKQLKQFKNEQKINKPNKKIIRGKIKS